MLSLPGGKTVNAVLEVKKLKKYFSTTKGVVKAVNDVSFSITPGETLGLVGESGSGKSTVAYTVMGLYQPSGGQILFQGQDVAISHHKRKRILKKELQIVFQDPGSSLNPRQTIENILALPIRLHDRDYKKGIAEKVQEILSLVELPVEYMEKYPRSLGGGEKQMVAIARALATNPSLIVLDEPTSALDVSIQAKIIHKLIEIQQEKNLGYLFITHDLSLMRNIAHRVAIMYLGRIVETAPAQQFFETPYHPYTRMLISSIPVVSSEEEKLKPGKIPSIGEIPSPVNMPSGCVFHPRCVNRMPICDQEEPIDFEIKPGHWVKCHLWSPNK